MVKRRHPVHLVCMKGTDGERNKPVMLKRSTRVGELTPEEREFYTLVARAPRVNPFGEERVTLDRKIAGVPESTAPSRAVEAAVKRVEVDAVRMEKEGRLDLRIYKGDDHKLVSGVITFIFFYRYRKEFDRLIKAQARAGEHQIRASFLKEAISGLETMGMEREEAIRTVEGCYQLRRAYHFIHHSLVGPSASMIALRYRLWNNVFTHDMNLYSRILWNRMEDFSTLILGETGTGKGSAAAAIGRSGYIPYDRKKGCFKESFTRSFLAINLSRFPESLIESELFGHRKGSFTGAIDDYQGVFSRCSPWGSIFLDEIGEVSIPVQIKLLQVLQERVFSPVGSHNEYRFKGRVIAATNKPVERLRTEGNFRDDFYYRLCSDVITVPPLRQRIEEDKKELVDLVQLLVGRMVGKRSDELTDMVLDVIDTNLPKGYPWPGNVRELEQCVRRVMLNRSYHGDEVQIAGRTSQIPEGFGDLSRGELSAHELITAYCHMLYQKYGKFEEVARRTSLDRRTVKKYVVEWQERLDGEEE